MAEYRQIMLLLLEQRPYRQIEVMADCSHRSIARARRVLDEQNFTNAAQIEALIREDLDRLFADGRKSVTGEFVSINIEKIVAARVGWKKPPLKVLWVKYLQSDAPAGVRHYGYDRFCELAAEHVRANDLTAPITHVLGHTMVSMSAVRAVTGNASQARAGERSGCTRPRYRFDPRALPNSSAKQLGAGPIHTIYNINPFTTVSRAESEYVSI